MNTKQIGRDFEIECIPILENLFDRVEWLAENNRASPYDFKCYKNNNEFNVDAKFIGGIGMPQLTKSQNNIDLAICKINGKILIYHKSCILGNLSIRVEKFSTIRPREYIRTIKHLKKWKYFQN